MQKFLTMLKGAHLDFKEVKTVAARDDDVSFEEEKLTKFEILQKA
jgi:hypothetical protein